MKKDDYTGLSITDIPNFEECFKLNVSVYSMYEQGAVILCIVQPDHLRKLCISISMTITLVL